MGTLTNPGNVETITKSDSVEFNPCRGIYVGTAGSMKFVTTAGQTITYANAVVGYHPIRIKQVWATGTTADDIHVLY